MSKDYTLREIALKLNVDISRVPKLIAKGLKTFRDPADLRLKVTEKDLNRFLDRRRDADLSTLAFTGFAFFQRRFYARFELTPKTSLLVKVMGFIEGQPLTLDINDRRLMKFIRKNFSTADPELTLLEIIRAAEQQINTPENVSLYRDELNKRFPLNF